MKRAANGLWIATLFGLYGATVLRTGSFRWTQAFTPMPKAGSLVLRLVLFVLLPAAVLTTLVAWTRLGVWLGVRRPRRRRDAP